MGDVMSLDQLDKVKAGIDALSMKIESIETLVNEQRVLLAGTPSKVYASQHNKLYYSSYTKIIDVTGSGCLRALSAEMSRYDTGNVGCSGKVKCVIDDKQIIFSPYISGNYSYHIDIVNQDDVYGGNSNPIAFVSPTIDSVSVVENTFRYMDESYLNPIGSDTIINSGMLQGFLIHPLYFKNNFSVYVMVNTTPPEGGQFYINFNCLYNVF